MVRNPPSQAGDVGSIPGERTEIPYAAGQLSPRATTTEPVTSGAQEPQREKPVCYNKDPARLLPPTQKKRKKRVPLQGSLIKMSCLLGCREPSGCSVHL